ncbi:MAG: hypothetical protein VX639_13765 [Pseudomonadota bacterium]|nr:hypothetical protein [Pseudomonadota bacterium]
MGELLYSRERAFTIAEDVGTTPEDIATAWGICSGIKSAVQERLDTGNLRGLSVATQSSGMSDGI